ncbi:hypothetical protein [Algoriphagus limi]|uniref:Uncharacterized protein n=1 Tax=Algoriphagus limi TaxID=2975273 RepID=A0ABT2G362_9BACT|nr:hypothetical protein [Algoriphagus limi]MCS5489707.1 hypothetical protein [Algoriphagus limi]
MNLSKILLPHRFQKFGWILFLPFAVLTFLCAFYEFEFSWLEMSPGTLKDVFNFEDRNLTNELAIIGLLASLFLISFSKEKEEDEYIQKLRIDSILLACYGYFLLNVIGTVVFYGVDYLSFIFFNMFSIPVLFILRFRWVMFKQERNLGLSL